MFQRLDNVGVAVRDLRRAMRFYTETLGLPGESGETDGWITIGGASLYLFEAQGADAPGARRTTDLAANPPGIDHISLGVDDIEAACAALEAKGIVFAGPIVGAPGEFRYRGFSDPEGNMLYLVSRP